MLTILLFTKAELMIIALQISGLQQTQRHISIIVSPACIVFVESGFSFLLYITVPKTDCLQQFVFSAHSDYMHAPWQSSDNYEGTEFRR